MARAAFFAFGLLLRLDGAVAATDSFVEECSVSTPVPTPARSEHEWSLMQHNFHSGVTASASDTQPNELSSSLYPMLNDTQPTEVAALSPMPDEAHLLQVAGSGGKLEMSVEELAEYDQEVDTLTKQLEERRALLQKLRAEYEVNSTSLLSSNSTGKAPDERVIVPVPYYMHKKSHGALSALPNPKHVVQQWYGDIIGDALEPTSHAEAEDHNKNTHHHSHYVLLLLFGSLVIGSCLQILLDRVKIPIPYTSMLFLAGSLASGIHWLNSLYNGHRWVTWYTSVDMWLSINPHLLFYIFLPALLFGDVMKLKVQLVAACSGQIFLLACPGVIFGTFATGAFAKYLLPYGWDWPICLVFGSILSATDPVAVVSLFNTLGVSPRLTMLISGESLVNDGTAIVVFALALKVAQGAVLSPLSIAYFFLYMIIPAIGIGFAIGFAAVALISFCSEVVGQSDAMIQVIVTISCGYLAFFIAENEFSSSGVIATVSAGLAVAHSAWPLFVSRETVHIVWEAIEFVGNTVIFFLAGLIFMGTVLSRHFGVQDFSWLLTLYVGMFLIRALMMLGLWIPLNMAGQPLQWQEGVAMVWSGLRGAVSLAMGMIVDIEPGIDKTVGSQVMFHVGGIAALTLIVNSLTIGPLMKKLGQTRKKSLMNQVSAKLSVRISEQVKITFHKELHNQKDARFYGANSELVKSMVPMLHQQPAFEEEGRDAAERTHNHLKFLNDQMNMEWRLVQVFREVFLRVVQSRYWQGLEDGVIPRKMMVSRVLLHSTEEALDRANTGDPKKPLNDWDIIARALKINENGVAKISKSEKVISKLFDVWPFRNITYFQGASIDFNKMMTVFVALSYIEAHTWVQEEIPQSLGRDDAVGLRVQKQVIHESTLQRTKALNFISTLPPEFVELGKSEMLARRLLRQHISEVEHKKEAGFLTQAEATYLVETSHKALDNIVEMPQKHWREFLPATDLKSEPESDIGETTLPGASVTAPPDQPSTLPGNWSTGRFDTRHQDVQGHTTMQAAHVPDSWHRPFAAGEGPIAGTLAGQQLHHPAAILVAGTLAGQQLHHPAASQQLHHPASLPVSHIRMP